ELPDDESLPVNRSMPRPRRTLGWSRLQILDDGLRSRPWLYALTCMVLIGCGNLGGYGDPILDGGGVTGPGPDGVGAGARTDAAASDPKKDGGGSDGAAVGDSGAARGDSGETGGNEEGDSGTEPDGGDGPDAPD